MNILRGSTYATTTISRLDVNKNSSAHSIGHILATEMIYKVHDSSFIIKLHGVLIETGTVVALVHMRPEKAERGVKHTSHQQNRQPISYEALSIHPNVTSLIEL